MPFLFIPEQKLNNNALLFPLLTCPESLSLPRAVVTNRTKRPFYVFHSFPPHHLLCTHTYRFNRCLPSETFSCHFRALSQCPFVWHYRFILSRVIFADLYFGGLAEGGVRCDAPIVLKRWKIIIIGGNPTGWV